MLNKHKLYIKQLLLQIKESLSPNPTTASPPTQLQPLPRPLSEWRGEWKPLFANKGKPHPRPLSEWRGEWILLFANKGKPLPQPLSEWRGEWKLLVGWKRVVRGDRGNCILKLRKRPSQFEEGVSLQWKGRLFDVKKRPLYLFIVVSTPLSIRRGDGGEAVDGWGWGFPSPSSNPLKEEPRELFFIELSGLQHY